MNNHAIVFCLLMVATHAWADAPIPAQTGDDDIDASYALHGDDDPIGGIISYINKNQISDTRTALSGPSNTTQYTSFGVGPAVKINPYVTAYGVVGAAADARSHNGVAVPVQALTLDENSRMYGVGMQIKPNEEWQIDMKYQKANLEREAAPSRQVNYFNVGVGYKFW